LDSVTIDGRVLAFALATSTLTGILFGLAPALALARSQSAQLIRGAEGASARGRGTLQQTMVAAELALSLMLLVGSALLARSLKKLSSVDPGFPAERLLNVRVALARPLASDSFATREAYRAVVERLRAMPGVSSASAGQSPFGGSAGSTDVDIQANPGDAPRDCSSMASVLARMCPTVRHASVMPGFLETLGVPLLAGRMLTDDDRTNSPRVVLVSEVMATRLFRGESPVNKQVHVRGAWREVVGVVGDTRVVNLSDDVEPTLYTPTTQHWQTDLQFLVRGTADPSALVPQVRAVLGEVAPGVAFVGAEPMQQLIRRSSASERYRTTLITVFGVVAALLAAGGMFGVTARAVSRRRRELGIRIALGATSPNVTWNVLRYTFTGAGVGITVGVVASMLASRTLTPFLFGVSATDRIAYAGSIGLLGIVVLVASWLPARRASRVQPSEILRQE
jgi:predicted permease